MKYSLPPETSKLEFNLIWPETNTIKSSIPKSRKRKHKVRIFKLSWILEGQDRECGFVSARRRLHRALPDLPFSKQLIGLPDYGPRTFVRDEETHEPFKKLAEEQPPRLRVLTRQVMFNGAWVLTDSDGPRQLCMSVRDAIYGLLNAFRMGYVHREVTPEGIYSIDRQRVPAQGYLLSKDGVSIEGGARDFTGILWDFTMCYKIEGRDKGITDDTEIFEPTVSTPTQLLEGRNNIRHSPIHDLESFLWVILSVATEIVIKFVDGEKKISLDCEDSDNEEAANNDEDEDESDVEEDGNSAEAVEGNPKDDPGKGGDSNAVNEDQMDTDDGQIQTDLKGDGAADEKMDEDADDNEASEDESDQNEKKRKRSIESIKEKSEKAKGKMKAIVQDENEPEPGENADAERPRTTVEDAPNSPKTPSSPPSSPPSHLLRIAEDPHSRELRTLLGPFKHAGLFTMQRRTMFDNLDTMLEGNVNLAPVRPLLCALRALAAEYYVKCVALHERDSNAEFPREQVEEAFARYLKAFEAHMPTVTNWMYLKPTSGQSAMFRFPSDMGFKDAFTREPI
ncbi:hypothetical protein DFH11DRAFT_128409 [Phellopilus nigrolimitatus]|nr:hypothetical protein DFH11DRAFT_128409 [Phellopilus nigrolimitatus]